MNWRGNKQETLHLINGLLSDIIINFTWCISVLELAERHIIINKYLIVHERKIKHTGIQFYKFYSVDEMWKEKKNKWIFLNIDNQVNEKLRMSKN